MDLTKKRKIIGVQTKSAYGYFLDEEFNVCDGDFVVEAIENNPKGNSIIVRLYEYSTERVVEVGIDVGSLEAIFTEVIEES